MALQGYIKLYRQIQENWLWQERRTFSKAEAWIDILLMVNHSDKKVPLGNELIPVKKGSRIISIRQLCEKWNWSNTKVKSFLELLQKDEMIVYKSDTKKTVLSVVNWELYQCSNDTETSQKHRKNVTETSRKHTNNNDKNVNNDKEIYTVLFEKWNSLKIIVHQKLTPDISKALDKVIKDPEYFITCMNNYATAFHDKNYEFCSYSWTLKNFINRENGYKSFADDGEKWINYQNSKKKSTQSSGLFPHERDLM